MPQTLEDEDFEEAEFEPDDDFEVTNLDES